jgi:magnesium transporter
VRAVLAHGMPPTSVPPNDGSPLWERLQELLEADDTGAARELMRAIPEGDVPRLFANLSTAESHRVLAMLDPELAGTLMKALPDSLAADMVEGLEPEEAAAIVTTLPSNTQADILSDFEPEYAEAVLAAMPAEDAAEAERLTQYAERSAGGLMLTEYLSYSDDLTVAQVLADLRAHQEDYQRHDVQYIYITDHRGMLKGVLRLRDLVLTAPSVALRKIMITGTDFVSVDATVEALHDFFATRPYRGVPVVDADGRLVGVVRHADVAEAVGEREASDHLKALGIVGGEELRTMPVLTRAWRRLSWLSINIVLNLIAASVIAAYQETLTAVIVLAVFLPIISDMSGCSGNQAIAVSMRELSLGLIHPADLFRVWGKELSVGMINSVALGVLLGGAAYLWQGNVALSLVVGLALALNTLLSVSLGGLVPLVLRGLRMDPALASGPILTTMTDMCGFFLVLSFATAAMPSLAG